MGRSPEVVAPYPISLKPHTCSECDSRYVAQTLNGGQWSVRFYCGRFIDSRGADNGCPKGKTV